MADVEVNQNNPQPPAPPPPPPERSGPGVWVVLVIVLLIAIALIWFVATRGEKTRIDLPEPSGAAIETPRVEPPKAPEVKVEIPDEVDVNVSTAEPAQEPPPASPRKQ